MHMYVWAVGKEAGQGAGEPDRWSDREKETDVLSLSWHLEKQV